MLSLLPDLNTGTIQWISYSLGKALLTKLKSAGEQTFKTWELVLSIRAEANININFCEYFLILVVFVKKNLVTNTRYVIQWAISP